jgi:hypothetical protein
MAGDAISLEIRLAPPQLSDSFAAVLHLTTRLPAADVARVEAGSIIGTTMILKLGRTLLTQRLVFLLMAGKNVNGVGATLEFELR